MTKVVVFGIISLLFVATCYGVGEKCSLEMVGSDHSFVSFGNTSCVLNGANIQTVEIWLYPIKQGETYADGIVFNSGWFDVNGAQKAFVLSVKQHDQLFGYVLSRPSPSGKVSEVIIASQSGSLKVKKWTHVLWHPEAQQFYLDGVASNHGNIFGSALSGISSFAPGDIMKVGQSFSGRLHALRLWSTLQTYAQILTHFKDIASCDKGIGANVIGFWDFTVCRGHHVPAFKGNSCGRLHKRHGFKWVSETESSDEITFIRFTNDSGHTWVDACSAESTCPTTCRTKHRHHGHHKGHVYGQHKAHDEDYPNATILPARVLNVNLIFALAFGTTLLVGGFIVACICRCRNAKKSEKPQNESEVEQLQCGSDDEHQIPLGDVVSIEPVYIPSQVSE